MSWPSSRLTSRINLTKDSWAVAFLSVSGRWYLNVLMMFMSLLLSSRDQVLSSLKPTPWYCSQHLLDTASDLGTLCTSAAAQHWTNEQPHAGDIPRDHMAYIWMPASLGLNWEVGTAGHGSGLCRMCLAVTLQHRAEPRSSQRYAVLFGLFVFLIQ